MFCRLATMGVANSRLLMLPNSEIRQNEGEGKASGFVRDAFGFGHTRMPKQNCSSGSSDACLTARVAPEECLFLSPHDFTVEMCGGYVCTLNCVMYRFIIRFIVALPVEP